jgi:hypothetical protein
MDVCDQCGSDTSDPNRFEIEPLDIVWCDDCMTLYLNGPQDDDEMDHLSAMFSSFTS